MEEYHLSGMSMSNQIQLFGRDGNVVISTTDFESPIVYTKDFNLPLLKTPKKIPFIRGVAWLINSFTHIIVKLWKNSAWIFVLLLGFISYLIFSPPTQKVSQGTFRDTFPTIIIALALFIFMFCATKNHGAEHKLISAFEKDRNLSLDNIKKQPKENKRCGTVLVVWIYILYGITLLVFGKLTTLQEYLFFFVAVSISYEIIKLIDSKDNWLTKTLFFPGWLGQKITTREPSDELLLRTKEGLIILLKREGQEYKD